MKNKPIYVEIDINTSMDNLWEASQNPSLHEQWDLRFSSITYLPKEEKNHNILNIKQTLDLE